MSKLQLPKNRLPRGATLRQEYVRCGRCPKLHGPYWYAYWKDYRGVTRKQYIGKCLPEGVVAPPGADAAARPVPVAPSPSP